ncbi:hypothetical protein [Methylobacterium sp. Leaf112]|uniref:hypothetical protein n=1 Tax=Methylobacterium sp. Leaf112 TaxID=1736258 RepID=UPI0012E790D3|nr:hypothetical protein [Methylobacterium sp. Leaf112]
MAASLVFACTAVTRFGVAASVPVWVTVMEPPVLAASWLATSWLPNWDWFAVWVLPLPDCCRLNALPVPSCRKSMTPFTAFASWVTTLLPVTEPFTRPLLVPEATPLLGLRHP